ncbi:uncharacterized protein B0J16DRAFT_412496 [Fusarium flagelliforme]|uniref:uncharacterized protein n=1 Tax=Fusarium flagelliforme TaxID=2675880 RepID=UPI001E8CB688|nr:uncharacterized protein B0J16DRAFT_412496 [Fusarium flagelliforme]KAH7193960.1 hypothetical protein B0J16DRAFT_412496 [Fusarium flagelliforme]
MVFPGTLSRGCTRCRKRRVKCDGRRPGCERCEKYKAPCPGYERPLAVRYYGKPGETLEREQPAGSSTSHTFAIEGGYKEGGEGGTIIRFKSPVLINPVLRQPQPSLEEESLTFFLHEYCVHPSQGVLRGHLDFLEGMYRNSDRASCIRPSTLAVAYLSLSRHYKSSTLYITAKKYYGAALHSVNRDLSVANRESLKEETLTSLMLLGIVEDLECQGQDIKTVHMKGIAMLFERVGQKVLSNISSSLYGWIFVHLQVPSLMSKQPMKCLVIPENQVDMTSPVMRLASVVAHCGDFYRAARQITTSDEPPAMQKIMLVKVLQQALAIAQGLAMAEEETMPPQQTTEKRPEGQTIAAFSSQWTAATWCFFASCMIVFFTMVYKCSILLLGLAPLDDQEKQLAETTAGISDMALKKTIHVFCQALPYVFGEVDARGRPLAQPRRQIAVMYHMVWPLSVAIASMHSTPQQIALCKMRLDMIRDLYGLKLAWYSVGLARDVLGLNDVET